MQRCPQYLLCLTAILGSLLAIAPVTASEEDEQAAQYEKLLKDQKVSIDGPELLSFIKQRTIGADEEKQIKAQIRELGNDDFDIREKASRDIIDDRRDRRGTGRAKP